MRINRKSLRWKGICISRRLFCLAVFSILSCGTEEDISITHDCEADIGTVCTMNCLMSFLGTGELQKITDSLSIQAYVVSSDEAGNFYNRLHLQDKPGNPEMGLEVRHDHRDLHWFYPPGTKVVFDLPGLFVRYRDGSIQIGAAYRVFGNLSLTQIPANVLTSRLHSVCDKISLPQPRQSQIPELTDSMLNTLVSLEGLQVSEEFLDATFAAEFEDTSIRLEDCMGAEIQMVNSGYADFADSLLPSGSGHVRGILQRDKKSYWIIPRSTDDINLKADRCATGLAEFTTDRLIISELGDPDNEPGARFVELYNASGKRISLEGWQLLRYTNANSTPGSFLDLSAYDIPADSTLVIASDSDVFEAVYGFEPDVVGGANSPADSNGDDNLELVDPYGNVIDAFGVPGEDGSGTNHEFEDGRAVRKPGILLGSPSFVFEQWFVYNDSGAEGTVEMPMSAPEDFNPGLH